MENPELILERLDAMDDDELIALIKEALDKSGIPYEEKKGYHSVTLLLEPFIERTLNDLESRGEIGRRYV